ncbi:MAG: hypothetical protein ACRCZF_09415, partial [Gemmataceae bacterium]
YVAMPGTTHTASTTFNGRVTGLVQLETGEKIALGSYNTNFATKSSPRLFSQVQDLDLTLDLSRCEPAFLKVALDPPTIDGSRKYWRLQLNIPSGEGRRSGWEGVIFLKGKSASGVDATIRIPVTGNGTGR